jgi:hypothetical protein
LIECPDIATIVPLRAGNAFKSPRLRGKVAKSPYRSGNLPAAFSLSWLSLIRREIMEAPSSFDRSYAIERLKRQARNMRLEAARAAAVLADQLINLAASVEAEAMALELVPVPVRVRATYHNYP